MIIMIKAAVMGATGYAGAELVRLLSGHPDVKITHLTSNSYAGEKISGIYPSLRGINDMVLEKADAYTICKDSDVVFTALPHGVSKEVIPVLWESGVKIIDFSGDYRYDNAKVYEKWYGQPHSSPELLAQSVYGLCELYRDKIKNARLIGNPGCYTTCSILALYPLLAGGAAEAKNIIIDAKSGVTGAGRGANLDTQFCECTESVKAYKVATHRHTSEIEQELSKAAGEEIILSFTPHLIPMKRGIFATCYANLKAPAKTADIVKLYEDFYKGEHFVRVYPEGKLPKTNYVAGSNFADIGITVDERLNRAVIVSCIDNLIKGAAGQAVQNMNIMFGVSEKTGIDMPAFYM